jgi:hypothetical protein
MNVGPRRFLSFSMRRFCKSIVCRLVAMAAALHFAIAPALAMSQCGCGTCECPAETTQSCCCGKPGQHKATAKSCCGNHGLLAQHAVQASHKSCCEPAADTCETAQGCSCQPAPAAEQNAVASRVAVKKLQQEAPLASVAIYAAEQPAAFSLRALPTIDRQAPPAVARHVLFCVWRN